jgi:hypothetical protein
MFACTPETSWSDWSDAHAPRGREAFNRVIERWKTAPALVTFPALSDTVVDALVNESNDTPTDRSTTAPIAMAVKVDINPAPRTDRRTGLVRDLIKADFPLAGLMFMT